jgi:hypothetical protein
MNKYGHKDPHELTVVDLLQLAHERLEDIYVASRTKEEPVPISVFLQNREIFPDAHGRVIRDILLQLVAHNSHHIEDWYYTLTSNMNEAGEVDDLDYE